MHWPAVYGLLTALTVGFCVYRRRVAGDDPTIAALWLALLWMISNFSHWFVPTPYNQYFPIADCLVGVILVLFWRRRMRAWKLALVLLLGVDMALHVASFRFSLHGYAYDLSLNLVYLLQLACPALGSVLTRRTFAAIVH